MSLELKYKARENFIDMNEVSLTTLQLAHRIAAAVLLETDNAEDGAQVVMRVLDETGHWFCRLGRYLQDMQPLPRQEELFK